MVTVVIRTANDLTFTKTPSVRFSFFLRSQQEQPILLLSRNICYITPFRLLLHQLSVLEML